MKRFKAELLQIPGIGPHKARGIARKRIKSMDALADLSPDDLLDLPGVGPALAAGIQDFFAADVPETPSARLVSRGSERLRAGMRRFRHRVYRLADDFTHAFESAVISVGDRCFGSQGL